MNETAEKLNPAEEYVNSLNLDYMATFVPQSQSRNKDSEHPTLNWRVAVGSIITDYQQGIAHLPSYDHGNRLTHYHDRIRDFACEQGLDVSSKWPHRIGKKLSPPALIDVLYSLVMDSDAIDYPTFEDWADTFGYDSDSRSGEAIYRQCLEIALKLRQMIDLDAAREAFQDY